jgi:hypothetical protein
MHASNDLSGCLCHPAALKRFSLVKIDQQAFAMVVVASARLGQRHAPRRAIEQFETEVGFQRRNLLRENGRNDIKLIGSGGE